MSLYSVINLQYVTRMHLFWLDSRSNDLQYINIIECLCKVLQHRNCNCSVNWPLWCWNQNNLINDKISNIRRSKSPNLNVSRLVLQLYLAKPMKSVLSRKWRCSWSSADRRCSHYIWVIDNFIVYKGASYIRDLTVTMSMPWLLIPWFIASLHQAIRNHGVDFVG